MGFAKRLWEEEQARQYHQSFDMVCAECFSDEAFKSFIEDHAEANDCTVCGRTSNEAIAAPADDVLEFFLERIGDYYQDANGSAPWDGEDSCFMVPTFTMSEIIFLHNPDLASKFSTLKWLYSKLKDDTVYCSRDWQVLSRSEALEVSWNNFTQM